MEKKIAELRKEVEIALDEVRPHLEVDGGNVEIVEITDKNELFIKWLGACESCNMATMTLRAGIEQAVFSKVPEITKVTATNGVVANR